MELDHQVGRLGWGPARSPGPWGWVSCLGLPLPNLVQLECLQWLHSLLPTSPAASQTIVQQVLLTFPDPATVRTQNQTQGYLA